MKRMLISNIYNKRVDKIRSGLIDHCQKSTRRFKREKKTYLQYTHTHIYINKCVETAHVTTNKHILSPEEQMN